MAAWRYEISLLLLKKYFTRSLCSLVKHFSTLEEKFRISARPCNILYLCCPCIKLLQRPCTESSKNSPSDMISLNRPFPSSKKSHFQNEAKCETFVVKMSFISMTIKNHFHINGFALNLALKMRLFGTRKWPIPIIPILCNL